jgi:hypothetical protein
METVTFYCRLLSASNGSFPAEALFMIAEPKRMAMVLCIVDESLISPCKYGKVNNIHVVNDRDFKSLEQ